MKTLRVVIVSNGEVVDVHELEDPRVRYIAEFNQLNQSTQFTAALDDQAELPSSGRPTSASPFGCRPTTRCRNCR